MKGVGEGGGAGRGEWHGMTWKVTVKTGVMVRREKTMRAEGCVSQSGRAMSVGDNGGGGGGGRLLHGGGAK